jgi:DNA polymerase II large subunit
VSESCGDYLARAADYLDELLQKVYGLPAYYNLPSVRGEGFASQGGDHGARRRALVGHLTIALAPHTSGGVLSRIIGYTKAQAHFGHPFFHAAKRRNCDGDEDAVMLLVDGLINFSRAYVPDRRGGLMDLPLLLSTRLDPNEVDKEAHNVDVLWSYPLEFFHATTKHAAAKEVAKKMGQVESRIGKPEQYEGFGFTHDTVDISVGPVMSAYKSLGPMMEKMTAQMELARKIRAVDEAEVGARVIGSHLLPDLMGNLKSFSKQTIRCPKCNEKYRRMPLKGVCLNCSNPNLTLTVHEGSVRKYLEISKTVATKYKIDAYTHQRILLLEQAVESLFQNDKVKKAKLSDFL